MMKKSFIFSAVIIGLFMSGCIATWEGIKEDSNNGWEATKELSYEAWEKTKDVVDKAK